MGRARTPLACHTAVTYWPFRRPRDRNYIARSGRPHGTLRAPSPQRGRPLAVLISHSELKILVVGQFGFAQGELKNSGSCKPSGFVAICSIRAKSSGAALNHSAPREYSAKTAEMSKLSM